MKFIEPTQLEIERLRIWAGETDSFSKEQITLCLAMERLGGNAMPAEIANYCETTEDKIKQIRKGIFGILVDCSTGRFWIK